MWKSQKLEEEVVYFDQNQGGGGRPGFEARFHVHAGEVGEHPEIAVVGIGDEHGGAFRSSQGLADSVQQNQHDVGITMGAKNMPVPGRLAESRVSRKILSSMGFPWLHFFLGISARAREILPTMRVFLRRVCFGIFHGGALVYEMYPFRFDRFLVLLLRFMECRISRKIPGKTSFHNLWRFWFRNKYVKKHS